MTDRPDTLSDLRRLALDGLTRSANDRNSDFRMPVLCTVAADGRPEGRTMVVRAYDPDTPHLDLYADLRGPKIHALETRPDATLVFWDRGKHLQLRVRGRVGIHRGDEARDEALDGIPDDNRTDYSRDLAPGTPREEPDADVDTDRARENFGLLRFAIGEIDALYLGREAHRRALFAFGDAAKEDRWLTP